MSGPATGGRWQMSAMRSKELAALAGVTPRALRHYHQIGLLPEPPRDGNGYRRYAVPDLIRLLRIKGLAAAGVALADIPSFLEGRGAPADDLLDALDRQLLGQISQLEQQRALVARLRNGGHARGADADLAESLRVLSDGRSDASNAAWQEQLTLFSHLLSREELAKLYAIYARMAHESEEFLALGRKFDALGPGSDATHIDDLAAEYAGHFRDMAAEFRDVFLVSDKMTILKLVRAHTLNSVNDSQRKMLLAVASRMR